MADEIRVLVVEDDENVRIGVEQAVALAGFPVSAYASAADAYADIAPGAPVVIVSDVRMPGIDGLQLLDHVMAIDPQIPVLLISGHADISTAVGAMPGPLSSIVKRTEPGASASLASIAITRVLASRTASSALPSRLTITC